MAQSLHPDERPPISVKLLPKTSQQLDQDSLLTFDIDNNIEPTIKFFESLLGPEDGLSLICSSPSILGGSLSKRFIPRRERMIDYGVSFTKKTASHMRFLANDNFDGWTDDREKGIPSKYDKVKAVTK